MASRQVRKSQAAVHPSESEDENSQQSSQEADMNVLKAARNVVSTVRASVKFFLGGGGRMVTNFWDLDEESSRVKTKSH
jgi:hypothetical protein